MGVDDSLHDRQPQTGSRQRPGAVGTIEPVEHPRYVNGVDARSGVVDLEHRRRALGPEPDLDRLVRGGPLAGVVDEVQHRPPQRGGTPTHPHGGHVEREIHVRYAGTRLGSGGHHHVGEVEQLGALVADVTAGQVGQLGGEGAQLGHLGAEIVEQPGPAVRRQSAVQGAAPVEPDQQLDVEAQAGERGLELVGGVLGEQPLGPAGVPERGEHVVYRPDQPPDLPTALIRDVGVEIPGVRDTHRGGGQPVDRRQAGPRHGPPDEGAPGHAEQPDQQHAEPELVDRAVVGEVGHLHRAVARPQRVDAVALFPVARLDQVGRRALRHAPGLLADRRQLGLAGRRPGRPVGQDDPHQPTGSRIRRQLDPRQTGALRVRRQDAGVGA